MLVGQETESAAPRSHTYQVSNIWVPCRLRVVRPLASADTGQLFCTLFTECRQWGQGRHTACMFSLSNRYMWLGGQQHQQQGLRSGMHHWSSLEDYVVLSTVLVLQCARSSITDHGATSASAWERRGLHPCDIKCGWCVEYSALMFSIKGGGYSLAGSGIA